MNTCMYDSGQGQGHVCDRDVSDSFDRDIVLQLYR